MEAASFLERDGFRLVFRSWGAQLNLDRFDGGRHRGLQARLEEEGLRLLSFEASSKSHPRHDQELTELRRALSLKLGFVAEPPWHTYARRLTAP